jgi:uncharacterized protein YcbX
MHLSELYLYPVKSARGIPLSTGQLDGFGLARDRRWMVVDQAGRFVSQREAHQLALVEVGLDGADLLVDGPGMSELRVVTPPADAPAEPVTVWADTCLAQAGEPDVAQWFSRFLGRPARLVYMPDTTVRTANPRYVPDRRRVAFADAYPLLLIGEGSLDELNRRMPLPLPMNRFRPNLVVAGSGPFAEDQWKAVAIGDVTMDVVKPCDRCVTTTVDQATGTTGREPLRTLAQFRKWNGQVYFGQNIVHRAPGTVRKGDPVRILSQGESNLPGLPRL